MDDAPLPATIRNADGEVIFAGDLQARRPDLLAQARALVIGTGDGSTARLQRKLGLSYKDACTLMARLEREGVVGPRYAAGKREVRALPVYPDDPLIFADPPEVQAASADALVFATGIVLAKQSLPNDARVRELLYPGVEAMLYALSQLRAPGPAERELIDRLAAWADDHIEDADCGPAGNGSAH